ncbi:hypothetical protein F3Y22_tig00116959pilonHSYRG00018 [Hibiscus syriacus]|uniref:S-protein homolog n=1 Tax=Hibiscus syriacus TaxID=106335 RepID=A0A6A2XCV3_HIBSY|nr:S-protein homolog 3-like [Hibiscus syriacus]KAE8659936.1 hypothetical protein F3Y22_tig00116959pilonHSYRG00018 [Hibiscus syriacus]
MNTLAIRLVWLLSVTLVLAASIEDFWDRSVGVTIRNDLENRKDLIIHCKSKDDDLGVHVLSYKESYDFRFVPHLLGRTLFFCRMTWNGKSHWFDVYTEERDKIWKDNISSLEKLFEKVEVWSEEIDVEAGLELNRWSEAVIHAASMLVGDGMAVLDDSSYLCRPEESQLGNRRD